jgi:PAS domain S-box-containing protein
MINNPLKDPKKNKNGRQKHASELRKCAEEVTPERKIPTLADWKSMSPEQISRLIHELEVHQIELQMQNEELFRIEKELDLARDRYFDLYDQAPAGYCTLNEEGVIIEANLKAAALLGTDKKALVNQSLTRFVFKEDQDLYYLYQKKISRSGEQQDIDLRMVRGDKTIFWVRMQTIISTHDAYQGPFYRIILTDNTEKKHDEDVLRESKAKTRSAYHMLRTLVQVIPDMIWLKDPKGVYLYCNPVFESFFGASRENIIGKTDYDFVDKELADFFRANDYKAMTTGTPCSNEELLTFASDGHQVLFETVKTPMFDVDGKMMGVLGIARDITKRKKVEEELQASLEEKEVLLREVHHRVKNNLAAIVGLFNLQRQAMKDPQAQATMAELSSRVRAMSLVHEKLYRSRSLSKIDFQDYLQSLISHLRTCFGSPGICCEILAQGVEIPLDLAVPCGMIINELVTNALKYAFPKETRQRADQDEHIRVAMSHDNGAFSLTVGDNGVGLPPGFKLQTVSTLGLILVRMLGEHQLGGRFEVDQSGGTRFSLTFSLRNGRKRDE